MTSRRGRFATASALVALAACAWSLAALSPLGAQEEEKKTSLLRGPFVSLDGAGTSVDVVVAKGETQVKLLASWHDAKAGDTTRSFAFEPAGQRLRARFEAPVATTVTYDVVAASGSLAHGTIDTLPEKGSKKLAFCALGDSGFPRRGDLQATDNQLAIAKLLDEQKPALVIHTGDLIYLKGDPQSFDALFFKPYARTLARVPLFITLGNHDVKTKNGQPTLDEFPYPKNDHGNRYYSFDAANVHFTCLESNEILTCETTEKFLATDQGKWLKADLAATDAEWKIVFFHHPLFTCSTARSKDSTTMRAILEKLLDDAGVDIALTGHDHFYHRSVRLRDGKPSDQGVVHLITGGGGAILYEGDPKPKALTESFASRYHLTRFDVDGTSLHVRAIGLNASGEAEVFDDTTLTSRKVH